MRRFRNVLPNIGQTSGRILFENESEIPLSRKKEKKGVYRYPTKYILLSRPFQRYARLFTNRR